MRRWHPFWIALQITIAGVAYAQAPAGRYVITTETVKDTVTGLEWERARTPDRKTAQESLTRCEALALGAPSGGWRLPNVKELASIVDARTFGPAMDRAAFGTEIRARAWTSTPTSGEPNKHYVIDFQDGLIATFGDTNALESICVR